MTKPARKLTCSGMDRGFTLIELMITLVVVGILSSIAVPSFKSFMAGQRIKTSSFDMMAALTLTRSEAIKRNSPVTATPTSSDWSKGWTVTTSTGTVLSRQSAMKGISASCLPGPACNSIVYNNSGHSSSAQSIQLSSNDTTIAGTRCISIDLSGRPNSKKGAC